MGLGQVDDSTLDESTSTNSSSSSGSSSSYPQFEERFPYLTIEQDEDGSWSYNTYPDSAPVTYKKRRSNSGWELDTLDPVIKKYWWNKNEFRRIEQRVERRFNADIWEVLRDDPERANKLITEAARLKPDEKPSFNTRTCAVCEAEHHVAYGDYREIGKRVVCKRHNVEDLHSAGLLD